jgi:hypothetical protein
MSTGFNWDKIKKEDQIRRAFQEKQIKHCPKCGRLIARKRKDCFICQKRKLAIKPFPKQHKKKKKKKKKKKQVTSQLSLKKLGSIAYYQKLREQIPS